MANRNSVDHYINGVLGGKIPAGRLVNQACERHLHDLEHAKKLGIYFDLKAANFVIDFFEKFLVHSKGEWAGKPFKLGLWECFILGSIFGWKRVSDGKRRFRVAYTEVARKNGKTSIAAGIGLFLFVADGEPGAEVFCAAPLSLDTKIPTPDGYITMGEAKQGDIVFNEQGQQTKVTGVSPVFLNKDCSRIYFDDGTQVVCDDDHLWQVDSIYLGESKAGISLKISPRLHRILTTKKIANTIKTPWGTANYRIKASLPLIINEKTLPIPPYTLGVWLGAGRCNGGQIVHHPDDMEIAEHIRAEGEEISQHGLKGNLFRYTVLKLRGRLTACNLLNNKRIPDVFLFASEKQRLELLRGLLDTDGTCTKTGEIRFTNRNKQLALGVYRLMASLGIIPKFHSAQVVGEPHWIVSARGNGVPLFHLKRKAIRQVIPTRRARNRRIIRIEKIESVPVKCISVDSPSHLFLITEGLIATHNTKREQACLSHSEATRMVKASPFLRNKIGVFKNNLHIEATNSKFEPLGADADTMDGLNVHGVIIDELHAHKNRLMWDVLDTATGARTQPLIFAITTAGSSRETVCWEQHDYAQKILTGTLKDETFFAYIAGMDIAEKEGDAEDDWTSEKTWRKANPNFGISVKEDDLRRKCEKAKQSPASQNAFFRLHLNKWVQQIDRFIDITVWNENHTGDIDERMLLGRRCYGGLDLSSVSDMSAWVMVFPDEDKVDILARFWCPEDKLYDTSNKYKEHYQTWHRQGFLETTPGNAIDFAFIRGQIIEDAQKFQLIDMNIDRLFQAHQLAMELVGEGIAVVGMGMGYLSFAAPMKDFERRLLERKLNHGGNPVLRWMADNVAVSQDPAGNLKPNKAESQGKIDGIVSLVMALDRLSRSQAGNTSVYDERGLLTLDSDYF